MKTITSIISFFTPMLLLFVLLSGCEKDPETITETQTVYIDTCLVDTTEHPVSDIHIGSFHEGGIVFYLDESGEHGLICALSNSGPSPWGCTGIAINDADGFEVGTGFNNAQAILNGCTEVNTAAYHGDVYSSGTFSDWYLPSKNELNEISLNRILIEEASIANGGTGFGADYFYWSSTQVDEIEAWCVNISDVGSQFIINKSAEGRVRPIRSF